MSVNQKPFYAKKKLLYLFYGFRFVLIFLFCVAECFAVLMAKDNDFSLNKNTTKIDDDKKLQLRKR